MDNLNLETTLKKLGITEKEFVDDVMKSVLMANADHALCNKRKKASISARAILSNGQCYDISAMIRFNKTNSKPKKEIEVRYVY